MLAVDVAGVGNDVADFTTVCLVVLKGDPSLHVSSIFSLIQAFCCVFLCSH